MIKKKITPPKIIVDNNGIKWQLKEQTATACIYEPLK